MITPTDIKQRRARHRLTQLQAALLIGVSYPAYRLWEAGGTKPTPENEEKIKARMPIGEDNNAGSESGQ